LTVLHQICEAQEARGFKPRSREEIDADLNAMRDEAEEEMQNIERDISRYEQFRKPSD
jgi:hypothetical protein